MSKKREEIQGLPGALTTCAVGALIAFCVTLLMMAVGAWAIASGRVPEDFLVRICCVGMGAGCMVGGLYSAMSLRRSALPFALVTGGLCYGVWLLIGQAMYGVLSPTGLLRCGLCALIGSVCAGMMAAGGKKSRN